MVPSLHDSSVYKQGKCRHREGRTEREGRVSTGRMLYDHEGGDGGLLPQAQEHLGLER